MLSKHKQIPTNSSTGYGYPPDRPQEGDRTRWKRIAVAIPGTCHKRETEEKDAYGLCKILGLMVSPCIIADVRERYAAVFNNPFNFQDDLVILD